MYFVCVIILKIRIEVRLVFCFCMFLPAQGLGHDVWSQGYNFFCVACHSYPWYRKTRQNLEPSAPDRIQTPLTHLSWESHPQWAPQTELSLQAPCSQLLGIYRVQEEAPACNSTLVLFPPGPPGWPVEAVMLGITASLSALALSRESPLPFWAQHLCLIMWKSTICHHYHVFPTVFFLPDPSYCNNYDSFLWWCSHGYRAVFVLFSLFEQWRAIVL